jgi:hypothetical protein
LKQLTCREHLIRFGDVLLGEQASNSITAEDLFENAVKRWNKQRMLLQEVTVLILEKLNDQRKIGQDGN